jgi:hypothetical protein
MRQRLVLVVSPAGLFASGARDWPISYELRSLSPRDDGAGCYHFSLTMCEVRRASNRSARRTVNTQQDELIGRQSHVALLEP